MKKVYALFTATLFASQLLAQDPAGSSLFISLEEFNAGEPVKWVDCGNDPAFDLTNEATLECWARLNETNSNQKLMGKVTGSFNSGYMMAVQQGRIYPEVWNPTHYEMQEGLVLPNGYWVHWAITYKAGDKLIGYINGQNVGEVSVSANPLGTNTNSFIIGIAPWDLANFQTWGQLDEVAVWNEARTEEEIQASMHKRLDGTEAGLVAYYDFDDGTGMTLTDQGPNGLDGTLNNFTDDWEDSRAVIGNSEVAAMDDLHAIWNGLNENPSFAVTDNGLSLSGFLNIYDYAVWGHSNGSGNSTANAPTNAPNGFERFDREWYVNPVGTVIADMSFNMTNAAGGGTGIANGEPTNNYTLMYRATTSDDFEAVAGANTYNGTVAVFNGIELQNGYYTVAVAEEQMAAPSSVADVAHTPRMLAFPNPANQQVTVQLNAFAAGSIQLIDPVGRTVQTSNFAAGEQLARFDVSTLAKGIYTLRAASGNAVAVQRVVVN